MDRRAFLRGAATWAGGALAIDLLGCAHWGRPVADPSRARCDWPSPRLDAHMHLRSPGLAALLQRHARRSMASISGASAVAHLKQRRIAQAFALSGAYLADADTAGFRTGMLPEQRQALLRQENDWAAREVAAASGRLLLFCSVNPKRPCSADEVARCIDVHGARGLKLHFWNSLVDLRQREQLDQVGHGPYPG